MIVWIDGTVGVGKSCTAKRLAELLKDKNAEYVDSDSYWNDLIQKDFDKLIAAGFEPHFNKYFLGTLRKGIESRMYGFGKMPVVSMSFVDEPCETELLDYFKKKGVSMLHIILEAKEETIISRIENDPNRSESFKNQQKRNVPGQIQYLEVHYPDAVRINTEDKSLDETVGEIMALL